MSKTKCNNCNNDQKAGHNYCRICGFHLTKGFAQNVRIAVSYNSSEKFCGYCGKTKENCKC